MSQVFFKAQVTKHWAQEGVEETHIEDAAHQTPVGQRLGIPREKTISGHRQLENIWTSNNIGKHNWKNWSSESAFDHGKAKVVFSCDMWDGLEGHVNIFNDEFALRMAQFITNGDHFNWSECWLSLTQGVFFFARISMQRWPAGRARLSQDRWETSQALPSGQWLVDRTAMCWV
jgi:hypothetical protein